ncbi:hypothetical protein [Clostridium sp. 'White wine YQ']|uniref:hypothetical protein n=1 Tax=Clostridium sp. 'White wine YQ' TaxID=3027474 RepID=UPI002366D19A|nr:hypothetical protein [Clostridium sp. 'White wine YQ']MDD7794959.1 hypothetical protein [Clostridium sp. 'White wine YQ']
MPGVWNINSVYSVGAKRLSSKLTFEVGEKFSGRIIKNSDGKGEFTIKLLDGWQFLAQLDGELTPEQLDRLLKFQVLGFDQGKLKLKLVADENKGTSHEQDPLQALIKSEGLAKNDIDVLKNLVKFNIPLTRENILKFSSIFYFNDQSKVNSDEINEFINNFLASKNISDGTPKALEVRTALEGFFKEFKNIDHSDILTMVENNIELTEENIKSYNNLFKNGKSIEKMLLNGQIEKNSNFETLDESVNNNSVNIDKSNSDTGEPKNNRTILPKEIYANNVQEKKVSMLDVLKKMSGEIGESTAAEVRIKEEIIDGIKQEIIKGESLLNKSDTQAAIATDDEEVSQGNLKDGSQKVLTKDIFKEEVETFLKGNNKSIENLNTKDLKQIANELKHKGYNVDSDEFKEIKDIFSLDTDKNEEVIKNNIKATNELVKDSIREKSIEVKNLIRELIVATKSGDSEKEVFTKALDFIKNNLNEFKTFNSISNNYYYMDVPLKLKEREYDCKLIIKDERGKGKKIDSTNIKMVVSVNTVNLGKVDAFLNLKGKNLYIDLKCNEEYIKSFEKQSKNLMNALNSLGYNSEVVVSQSIEEVNLTNSREFFNSTNLVILDRKV